MGISRPWPCRHSTSRNNIIRSISQQCQAGPIPQGASRASAGPGLAGITTQHNSIMSISRQCPTQSKPTARASWTSAGLGLAGITTRNNIIIELATSARQEPHSIMSISPWRKEADQEREPHGHQLALALQAFYQPKQHHQEHQPPMSGRRKSTRSIACISWPWPCRHHDPAQQHHEHQPPVPDSIQAHSESIMDISWPWPCRHHHPKQHHHQN